MYSIRLKKFALVAETIQQEGHQFKTVAFRQLRVNILKLLCVCYAIIGRQLHPRQQHRGVISMAGFNDGFKAVANGIDGCTAQSVITAEFENDDVRAVDFKRLFDAVASTHRGFATDAVVDQVSLRLSLQSFLQQTDPSSFLRQAVAGGQAVAEYHNSSGCGCGRGSGYGCGARVGGDKSK